MNLFKRNILSLKRNVFYQKLFHLYFFSPDYQKYNTKPYWPKPATAVFLATYRVACKLITGIVYRAIRQNLTFLAL